MCEGDGEVRISTPDGSEEIAERMEQTNRMVDILSDIIEFRNGESGSHVRQIRRITELLLREYRRRNDDCVLSDGDIMRISLAAAIHDIGKIAISSEILDKCGKLTPEEFSIIKDHTLIGVDMVKELAADSDKPLVKNAYEVCRWHHERYDGSGYPDGLVGEEIPLSARVVGLADVYCTMTADRIYKKALDHDTVIRLILEGKCGVFDPELLECLKAVADRIAVL